MNEIQAVLAKWLKNVKRTIAKRGPLTWNAARMATRSTYEPRDARSTNEVLQGWISGGELKVVELANGDSLIAV